MITQGVLSGAAGDDATSLSYTAGATAYLYNLAWTGDAAFLRELEAAVIRVGDAKKLTGVSAMRASMFNSRSVFYGSRGPFRIRWLPRTRDHRYY